MGPTTTGKKSPKTIRRKQLTSCVPPQNARKYVSNADGKGLGGQKVVVLGGSNRNKKPYPREQKAPGVLGG